MTDSAYVLRRDLVSMLPPDGWSELVAGFGAADPVARLVDLGVFSPQGWSWVLDEPLLAPLMHAALVRARRLERVHLWQWGRLGALVSPAMDAGRTPGVCLPLAPSGQGLALAAGLAHAGGRTLCMVGARALKTRAFSRIFPSARKKRTLCLLAFCEGVQACEEIQKFCRGKILDDRSSAQWSIEPGVWIYNCHASLKGGPTRLTQSVKESLLERLRLAAGKEAERPWDMNFSLLSGDL